MNRLWLRLAGIALLLAALWPELPRQVAEWRLTDASVRLQRLLRGQDTGTAAVHSAQTAAMQAHAARSGLRWDPRVALLEGTALLLLQQYAAARTVFETAIRQGERPELSLNLGRALAALGDEEAAQRAFARAAWAAPQALDTLPRATREALLAQVAEWETQLLAGQLQPLPGQPP